MTILRTYLLSFSLILGVSGSEDGKHSTNAIETPALQPAPTSEALPSKPSEEHIEVLTDKTVTNRITKLTHAAKAGQYQTALESARKLREGKELKRA